MEKIKGYRIGLCSTLGAEDGKHLCEPYFKVYAEYENGDVWFEDEFKETLFKKHRKNITGNRSC